MTERNKERRAHARHPYTADLHYRPATMQRAQAVDLSEQGMAFLNDASLAVGTELDLYLINLNVRLEGRVQHCHALENGRFLVGMQFIKAEPELVDVLLAAWNSQQQGEKA